MAGSDRSGGEGGGTDKTTAATARTISAPAPVVLNPRTPKMALAERLIVGGVVSEAGGMAVIRQVRDNNLQRVAAIKLPRPEVARDQALVRGLIEEAQVTAQLDHPNIVPVHELGVDAQGDVFFTMKLVRGRTLGEILAGADLRRRTDRGLFLQLQVFLKVCDAVAFAHSRGVLHLDLKPGNIMVGEFGEVFVMDWGLARLRSAPRNGRGVTGGTLSYMAPELAIGDASRLDERTDVFMLGGVLYETLTGKRPHGGGTPTELLARAVSADVAPPDREVDFELPARLCRIAMKALARDPAKRYQTVADLARDVESFFHTPWRFPRAEFRHGALIIREGEDADCAYVVLKGRCVAYNTVDGRRVVLREMVEGDVFGEVALLTQGKRTASVEALEDVEVLVIERSFFEEELGTNHWLSMFVRTLAARFTENSARMAELEAASSRPR
ncbi:MAG: cyclic nucleotide-binding domain-containing protein [Deltaproteobacteria bacterium]|nr:cyclic nucleotide-binding domain-containing protein [Deltaproteobacteria bacterium]